MDDGEEITLKRSVDKEAILAAMFTTDEDRLWFHRPVDNDKVDDGRWRHGFGWVYFVYGNDDGENVINDYTTNLEEVMTEANKLADQYA